MPTRAGHPTAAELVTSLARREISACELAVAYLERIDAVNPVLNAAVHVDAERTLAEAEAADIALGRGERRPLLGLPISIKDSIDVAGRPCLSGSFAREGRVPDQDATVVSRLRAAGAVILCKTNVPEYTWSVETDNAVFGRTNNPYDPARTSGGSSGGEAALHAVGASPAGIGSDGLNSIRVPAHFCGTAGIRPTAGTVPETGAWPPTKCTGMLDMSTLGPMAASVDDLALLLPLIVGPDDVDPLAGADPRRDPRDVAIAGLRVGFYVGDGVSTATVGTRAAVERAAHALADAGAHVDQATPPPLVDVPEIAFRMMAADGGARARADLAPAGGRHVEQMTRLLEDIAPFELSAAGFFELMERWAGLRSSIRRFVATFDVVLCPVAAGPAPLHGCRPSDDGELTSYDDYAHSFAYAIAGLPSASVPAGGERGLPIGVQVVAHAFRDDVALAAASYLESALIDDVPPAPALAC
jgi:Asp-tRNA(Asn)/Glu-tRNA(Gln) amidotransferase A subunit family amidase